MIKTVDIYKRVFLICLLPVIFLMSGCIREKVIIKINKDGSGKIFSYKVLIPEASLVIFDPSIRAGRNFKLEDVFEMERNKFGKAKLDEIKYIDRFGQKGWIAVYSFKDIDAITIPANITFMDFAFEKTGNNAIGYDVIRFKTDKEFQKLNVIYPKTPKTPEKSIDTYEYPSAEEMSPLISNILGIGDGENTEDYYKKILGEMLYEVIIEFTKDGNMIETHKLVDFNMKRLLKKDIFPLKYIMSIIQTKESEIYSEGLSLSFLNEKYPEIFNKKSNFKLEIK